MREGIGFACFSAVVGTFLGYLLRGYSIESLSSWLLLLSGIILMMVSLAMIGPLYWILQSAGSVNLTGQWNGRWQYRKEGELELVVVNEDLKLRQYGQFFYGESSSTSVEGPHPFKQLRYKLRGRVQSDGTVEGRWWNTEAEKRYRGVFLGRVNMGGRDLRAVWIGTDNVGVNSGEWKLERR